jgi:hypothetical protein
MGDGGSDSSVEYRKGLFTAEMQKLNLSYSEPTVNWRFFSNFVYYLLLYLSAVISNNSTTATRGFVEFIPIILSRVILKLP